MAEYNADIVLNKGKITKLEDKISAAEAKDPRTNRDDLDILRWSQEITVLKLENEILEIKKRHPDDWGTNATLYERIKEKETKLEEMRTTTPGVLRR